MKKLIQFELRKIFSKRLTQVTLIALLLLSFLLGFSAYQNMYAFDGKNREGTGRTAVEIDKSVAEKYEGILTDEKVQQMIAEFKPTQDLHGMNAVYLYQNSLQSALFRKFSDMNGNWNGLSVSDVFGNEEIKIGYTHGWLKTSENMVRIFIVLSLVVAIMTAPVFSGEYGGVDNIILTSKYGKTKCATAKIIGSILAALIVTIVVSAINLIYAFILYGNGGLDCSILFAPADFVEGYIPFTFPFPIMLPVTETSPLFKIITLLPLYHAQFVSLMSVEQISGNVLYALMAVPVALILMGIGVFISRRIFAKHQVS